MARKAKPAKKQAKSSAAKKKGALKTKGGPDEIDVHVGSRVRLRRMIIGMSQEALGQAVDLSFQQIQKYEKGGNRIGAGRLYRIAKVLGAPIQFFFDEYDAPAAAATGFAEDGLADSVTALLHSPEGVQLCRYFSSIKDPQVKRRVLDLVRSIAQTEGDLS